MSTFWFNAITLAWTAIALIVFFALKFIAAPYGRHTSDKWGVTIDNKLGWILMEAPSFIIILAFALIGNLSSYAWFLSGCWLLHYLNRAFIFPFRIRTTGKRMPLFIVFSSIFINGMNAGLNGYYLAFMEHYNATDFFQPLFFIGAGLFVFGAFMNNVSDHLLINLRKPGETGYKIPHGWFYRWVSCPNLLGEIIEWAGFALMAWNLPALSFFIWTVANLIPRAVRHHQWYKEKFKDYPENRKAVIPFLV